MIELRWISLYGGYGCFTTVYIPKDTVVLVERGIPVNPVGTQNTPDVIIKTSLPSESGYGYTFYNNAGMFNHSCDPNVMRSESENGETVFTTIHDIPQDTELCIMYADKEDLADKCGFICKCLVCRE